MPKTVKLSSNDSKPAPPPVMLILWIIVCAINLAILCILYHFFPNATPFTPWTFWEHGSVKDGVIASWPIFLWGTVVTTILSFATVNSKKMNHHAEEVLVTGLCTSVIAGIFEELAFRWLIFMNGIFFIKFANFLIFGWLGFGLAEFFHNWIFGAFVNWITFGKLEWLIFGMGWLVGASALAANAKFRKGHAYLGIFGLLNSWIIGFFFFWLMFTHGLLAAIVAHTLYDVLIYVVRYVDCAIERALGMGTPEKWTR